MNAGGGARYARPHCEDDREALKTGVSGTEAPETGPSETGVSETAPSSQRAGWPRLVLSIVAATVGIPGFVAAGFGFPGVDAVAFGATSLIIASVIGCFALVWNANRRDAIMSATLLAGALGLAFIAVYAAIHYREIHEISIRGDSSPSARGQALALICGPVMVGLWFLLLGLGAMRNVRKKGGGDKKEPEARVPEARTGG